MARKRLRKFLLKIACFKYFRKLESWRLRSHLPNHHQRIRKRNSASVNRRDRPWWWPWDEEVHSECSFFVTWLFVTFTHLSITVSGIAWWMTVMPTGQTVKKRSFLCRKISLSLAYLSRHRMNIDILSSMNEFNFLSVLSVILICLCFVVGMMTSIHHPWWVHLGVCPGEEEAVGEDQEWGQGCPHLPTVSSYLYHTR